MKPLFWVVSAFYLAVSLGSLTSLEMSFLNMAVFIALFFNSGVNSILFSTALLDSNAVASRLFSSRTFIGYLILGQVIMFIVDLTVSYGLWYLCFKKGFFKRIGVMRTNW